MGQVATTPKDDEVFILLGLNLKSKLIKEMFKLFSKWGPAGEPGWSALIFPTQYVVITAGAARYPGNPMNKGAYFKTLASYYRSK